MIGKVGLVLSGGGAKGAYQVGVLKALAELDVKVDVIAGTSIGALNGGIVASAPDLRAAHERLYSLWLELAKTSPLKHNIPRYFKLLTALGLHSPYVRTAHAAFELAKRGAEKFGYALPAVMHDMDSGLLDDEPLKQKLDQYLDLDALMHGLPLYIGVYETNGAFEDAAKVFLAEIGIKDTADSEFLHVQSLARDEQKNALMASAAIPILFEAKEVNGKKYTDGGQGGWQKIQGNTPITPLINAGCSHIIVTHLNDGSPWDRSQFPEATILEIRPDKPIFGGLTSMLGFSTDKISGLIEEGYRDTKRCVGRVYDALMAHQQQRSTSEMLQETFSEKDEVDDRKRDAMANLRQKLQKQDN